jgi:hypothetical protein
MGSIVTFFIPAEPVAVVRVAANNLFSSTPAEISSDFWMSSIARLCVMIFSR